MSLYESVFIARQDVSVSALEKLMENINATFEKGGGKVHKTEDWGLRTLAYKIKKNRKGHYIHLNIESPAPAMHEYERQLRINEDILRYMTIRVDELEEGPSIMLRNKES